MNKLLKMTTGLIPEKILLDQIKELDEPYWSHSKRPLTCKEIADHSKPDFINVDLSELNY